MTARLASQFALGIAVFVAAAPFGVGQGFPPDEAVKRMRLPDGFGVRAVAAEPLIRQPVSISFDARGRLWVLQYLQYPTPAGLKAVTRDEYLRTVWDKVPAPPPKGDKGADRLTILSDPDENGVFRKSKDFLTGLNCASGFCLGNGGVYVLQAPYLLFYPDKNDDDAPDGDPDVLLSGFGMEDSHSTANSLQWGPDGWLYGAQGSTVTARIANPADPKTVVEFQQGVWRYHPKTRQFELFSEGGGNTWGLDFDKHGQVIAGTNWGGFACLHQMQGAYYVKGFAKHGPLHNPHAYGYLDHIPYKDFKGGHVTCGGVVYQADTFPAEYRDQYIAGNLLSNAVYMHKLEPAGSSFTARHGADLLVANDTWFRPVDLLVGPDGSVYVADWYDKRAAHLDPVDNWDRTNGRVYKIEYRGTPKLPAFDLRKKTAAELVELLKHPNKWWRTEARRLLAERQDKSVYDTLRKWAKEEKGLLALEAVWALYVSGGWDHKFTAKIARHPNEHVRAWVIRLAEEAGDPIFSETHHSPFYDSREDSPVVLAQWACTAKRLSHFRAGEWAEWVLTSKQAETDPQLALLAWWAIEASISKGGIWTYYSLSNADLEKPHIQLAVERIAQRFSADIPKWNKLIIDWLNEHGKLVTEHVIRGMVKGLRTNPVADPPAALVAALVKLHKEKPTDEVLLEVLFRLRDDGGIRTVRERAWDEKLPDAARVRTLDLLRQTRDEKLFDICHTQLFLGDNSDAVRVALLAGLETIDNPKTPKHVLAAYPKWSPAVKKRAVGLLTARPAWALALLTAVDAGTVPKADVTVDQVRPVLAFRNADLTKLVEKHWGKIGPAAAGEKQARVTTLSAMLAKSGPGDPAAGRAVFAKHCAACHVLHGEGGKVGPDLTTADRKNRGYLLAQIVDPSGYIRPEYVSYTVATADGRTLAGLVEPGGGDAVTLVTVVDGKPQKTVVPKADIDTLTASPVSLMPEKLLDSLPDADIRDLFAFLAADAPKPAGDPKPPAKKLKVCLVSGSLEYKSDESLAAFQKYAEANFPVECVRAFRKSDTDIPGLDALDSCDAAVFFTRRLKPDAGQLALVKKFVESGKPVVGVRTASHGFQDWLAMDRDVFGGDYRNHYKEGPATDVKPTPAGADHPVLTGVKPFASAGSLYKNPAVAKDVTVLLTGSIPGHTEPVAWVRERKFDGKVQRVFYTSLGHPTDFADANFTRLLANGLLWAAGRDVPK